MRIIAQKRVKAKGQPVIIDKRTGTAGAMGAELVTQSASDGYSQLLVTNGTNAIKDANIRGECVKPGNRAKALVRSP